VYVKLPRNPQDFLMLHVHRAGLLSFFLSTIQVLLFWLPHLRCVCRLRYAVTFLRSCAALACHTMAGFAFAGMGSVMPYKSMWPRWGHNVFVTFGDPIPLDDLTCKCGQSGVNQEELWRQITQRVHAALHDLEVRSVTNTDQVKSGQAKARHVHSHDGSDKDSPL
jgi:hypothetical protein